MNYIAIAQYHDQPPIDTPACRVREAHQFSSDTPIEDIWKWAQEKIYFHGELESLEITIAPDIEDLQKALTNSEKED